MSKRFPQGVPLHPDGPQGGEDFLEVAPVADLDLAGKEMEDGLLHSRQAAQRRPDLLLLVGAVHRGDEDPRDGGLSVRIHRIHITGRSGGMNAGGGHS